jgi:hypothetical protein
VQPRASARPAHARATPALRRPGGLSAGIGSLAAGGAEARQGDGGAVGLTQGARASPRVRTVRGRRRRPPRVVARLDPCPSHGVALNSCFE